ncbi:MAG: hypothetical protein AAFY33_01650 [Cyanobacteria bacterium J06643_4]
METARTFESQALEQLRSHALSELFTKTLGWQTPTTQPAIADFPFLTDQNCTLIAQRDSQDTEITKRTLVWQVVLAGKVGLSPALRKEIYTALSQCTLAQANGETDYTLPLVIIVSAKKKRSFWCESFTQNALYVVGQPTEIWQFRLQRLAKTSCGLFPRVSSNIQESLTALVQTIFKGIDGIEGIAQRKTYAVLTLQRLIFIQQSQQRGWLDSDTWYLQNRFEQALQEGDQLFFTRCLQPLYQALSMPAVERPIALHTSVGKVPYFGQLFHTHRIEALYPAIRITDQALEAVLGWLSEQGSSNALNPWISSSIGYGFSHYWQQAQGGPDRVVGTSELARVVCTLTLDRLILERLGLAQAGTKGEEEQQSLNDLLFNADSRLCRRLIQEILPALQIVDPACGCGHLLTAYLQRLTEIFSLLTGYIQQTQDAQLKIWRSGLIEQPESTEPSLLLTLQTRILQNNLYGVEVVIDVAEGARFQLLQHLVGTAGQVGDLEPLPDLEFSVMSGNALVGFIRVDEERFDQVNRAGAGSVLQGNLLQPLAADSYKTILSEKNVALEHYLARSQVLATTHSVPEYARAALLREQILALDAKAQHKLDTLLLNHMSQQLGIRYRESQLTHKPQRRPLELQDIEQCEPFHWGYHFSQIIRKGGFDIVACYSPQGICKPTVKDFIQTFPDLADEKKITAKGFKTSKQSLAKGDVEIAEAWLAYQDRYTLWVDYFQRSELFVNQLAAGRRVRSQFAWERLFAEQCFNLLNPEGIVAIVAQPWLEDESAQALKEFLKKKTHLSELIWAEKSTIVISSLQRTLADYT